MYIDRAIGCASSGIYALGECKDAKSAFTEFCKQVFRTYDGTIDTKTHLTNFYVYLAGPEVPQYTPGGSHHSKKWVRYGTNFTDFLRRNKLGKVVSPGAKLNLKHHRESTAQIWVWSPNEKAVKAWYKKNVTDVKIAKDKS